MKRFGAVLGMAAVAVIVSAAYAEVIFNPETGAGFVGKGDVQLVFGWNNKALQDNAENVQFQAMSGMVSETTWTCKRDAGEQTQERTRTTTTSLQGVVSHTERVRNQITGFILAGYNGDPVTSEETDGPAIGSCPNFWSVIEGPDTEVLGSSGGGLQVSVNGSDWFDLE
jgi:hypothetical protein